MYGVFDPSDICLHRNRSVKKEAYVSMAAEGKEQSASCENVYTLNHRKVNLQNLNLCILGMIVKERV